MADARIFLDAATAIFPTFLAFSSTVSLLIPSACRKRKLRRQRKKLTTEDRHDGDKPPQPQAADARASRTTTSSKRENERPAVAVVPSATEKFSENLHYNYYHSHALVKAEEQKSTSASSDHSSLGPDWQSPKWSNSLQLAPAGEKTGRNTFNSHDGVIEIDVTFGAEGSEGAASSSSSSTAPSTFSPYPKVEKDHPVHESNSTEPSPSSWSPVDLPPLPITSQLPTLVAWFMFSAAANDSVYLFICATIAVAATSNFLLYPVVFDCARYKWDFFLQSVVSLLLAVLLFVLWFFGPWRERPGVWGIFATVLGVPYYTSAVFGMYVGVSESKPDALGSLTMNCAAIAASLSWTLQGWFVARVPELAIGCGVYTLVNSAALVVNLCLRARLRMQKGNRKRNSCASNQSELQEEEEVVSSEPPPLPPPLDAFADAEPVQVAGREETIVGEEKKRKMNATMSKYCAEEHQLDFRMTSSVSCATNSTVASTSASVTSAV